MTSTVCEPKIALLLAKIQKRCKFKKEQLDKLLSAIRESKVLIFYPSFYETIVTKLKEVVSKWHGVAPKGPQLPFFIELVALLSKDENAFQHFNSEFYKTLLGVSKAKLSGFDNVIKLSHVRLLSCLLDHLSGVELICVGNFWEDVLDFKLYTLNDETFRESVNFFKVLLKKTTEDDRLRIAKRLLLPLEDLSEAPIDHFRPLLNLLGDLFEALLENAFWAKADFGILLVFLKVFHQLESVKTFLKSNKMFLNFVTARFFFTIQFLEIYVKLITKNLLDDLRDSVFKLKENFFSLFYLESFQNNYNFLTFSFVIWRLIERFCSSRIPDLLVSDQIAVVSFLPSYFVVSNYCTSHELMEDFCIIDDLRGSFVDNIYKMGGQECRFLHKKWFLLVENSNFHVIKISIESFEIAKRTRKLWTKSQVILFFQMFVYHLEDISNGAKYYPLKIKKLKEHEDWILKLFEVFQIFMEDFEITWKDSIESVNIVEVCCNMLEASDWSKEVVVEVFKVINVAISKYMTPNLVLLMDKVEGSTVASLGPLLSSRLFQDVPEVKNQCLEVVSTIARLSIDRVEATLIALPIFVEWLESATTMWSTTGLRPNPTVVPFLLNLSKFLAQNEERFYRLTKSSVFIKLISILELRQARSNSLKLQYVNLLSKFLEHETGIDWLKTYEFWEDIHSFGVTSKNSEVFEESAKFFALFLKRAINDQEFCDTVIKKIVSAGKSTDIKVNDKLLKKFRFIFRVLEFSLEVCHESEDTSFEVFSIFFINLQSLLNMDFLEIDVYEFEDYRCRKGIYILKFLELVDRVSRNSDSVLEIVKKIKTIYVLDFTKREYQDVVEYLNFTIVYFSLINKKILDSLANQCVFQSIVLLLIPFYSILQSFPIESSTDFFDEYRNDLIDDMVRKLHPALIRSSYKWRDKLAKSDCFRVALKSLKILKEQRKFFTRNEAVLIFQTCIYCLEDFNRIIKIVPEKIHLFYTHSDFFFETFNVLNILLNDFEITWNDIYEIIYLMPLALDFATLANCPRDITFLVLEVVRATIEKSDAPNLTLLFDTTSNLFGPLVHCNLFHESAEMRKVTLRIVHTVAHATRCKFPSLQKVLMDSELPTLVVKMSACDGESFVRATAIKCLQEMIQVEEIWNNALKSEDLPQKMRDVLLNEPEGIVRVEAATFMCVAYEHQQFPKDTLERVYETMIYSSTADLHWEVKVRALGFWDKVIKSHLQNQGMIDDSFPNVTFSKEHRKIVTLTDSEIRKRLLKVLGQLSEIGCLGVLTCAIKDDCDMEVSKTAVKIAQRLVDLFIKYKLTGDGSAPTSPAPTENGHSTISMSSGVSVDDCMDSPQIHHELNEEVIDQIVNSKDVNLLKGVYSTSDYGSVSNYDIQVKKIVTPNEFLQFTQQDLNALIAEKKKWLNGIEDLGSLLDDMLKTYDDEVNNMDCY